MDLSWKDSVYAVFSSCFPCSARPRDADDGTLTDGARYAVLRDRADELEGLLADADDDAAQDADAISLHSHLGPRGRRRPPPRTPRHISFWGFNLFGSGPKAPAGGGVALPDGGDDVLHRSTAEQRRRRRSEDSTDRLLADAAAGPAPRELADADIERRARRRARKEMRRLAKAAAAAQGSPQDPNDSNYFAQPGGSPPIPPQFLLAAASPQPQQPPPAGADALAHMQAQDDEDAADLDGVSYARLAPRPRGTGGSRSSGRSSTSGSNSNSNFSSGPPPPFGEDLARKKTKKSKRSTKSGSSATSSTLASPSAAAFPSHQTATQIPYHPVGGKPMEEAEEAFDGTPGGLDYGEFVVAPQQQQHTEEGEEFDGSPGGVGLASPSLYEFMTREALPSPGLSRSGRRGSTATAGGGAFLAGI